MDSECVLHNRVQLQQSYKHFYLASGGADNRLSSHHGYFQIKFQSCGSTSSQASIQLISPALATTFPSIFHFSPCCRYWFSFFVFSLWKIIKTTTQATIFFCWVSTNTANRVEAITSCAETDVGTSKPMACRLAPVGVELTCHFIPQLHVLNRKDIFLPSKKKDILCKAIRFTGLPFLDSIPPWQNVLHISFFKSNYVKFNHLRETFFLKVHQKHRVFIDGISLNTTGCRG
jgi:hypothetical protein